MLSPVAYAESCAANFWRRFSSDDHFHGARISRSDVQVTEGPCDLRSSSTLDDMSLHRVTRLDQPHLHGVSVGRRLHNQSSVALGLTRVVVRFHHVVTGVVLVHCWYCESL